MLRSCGLGKQNNRNLSFLSPSVFILFFPLLPFLSCSLSLSVYQTVATFDLVFLCSLLGVGVAAVSRTVEKYYVRLSSSLQAEGETCYLTHTGRHLYPQHATILAWPPQHNFSANRASGKSDPLTGGQIDSLHMALNLSVCAVSVTVLFFFF